MLIKWANAMMILLALSGTQSLHALESTCDGVDDDGDGRIDEGLPERYFPDLDGDGFGDTASGTCYAQPGYIGQRGDCDDVDPTINPLAVDLVGDFQDSDCGGTDGSDPSVGIEGAAYPLHLGSALVGLDRDRVVWVNSGVHSLNPLLLRHAVGQVKALNPGSETVIEGARPGIMLTVRGVSQLSFSGFTFRPAETSEADETRGAVLMKGGSLQIEDCSFEDWQALTGPALNLNHVELSVKTSRFEGNRGAFGGAISALTAPLYISGSRFIDNGGDGLDFAAMEASPHPSIVEETDQPAGGALLLWAGESRITDSHFEANTQISGGAIAALGGEQLSLLSANFWGGSAERGGEIFSRFSSVDIEDSQFHDGQAEDGGAIYAEGSRIDVADSAFTHLHAVEGAGLALTQTDLHLSDTLFDSNAAEKGGAISAEESRIVGQALTFSNLTAKNGGALRSNASEHLFTDILAIENQVSVKGGFAEIFDGDIEIDNSHFEANQASISGGVFELSETGLIVRQSRFERNHSDGNGGVFTVHGQSETRPVTEFDSSVFIDNTSNSSGSVIVAGYLDLWIHDTIFSENRGSTAIVADRSTLEIQDSEFSENESPFDGGALRMRWGALNVDGGHFIGNTSGRLGGAIYLLVTDSHFQDTTFVRNRSETGPGAIHTLDPSEIHIQNSVFEQNSGSFGGALGLYNDVAEITDTRFSDNFASDGAGAIATIAIEGMVGELDPITCTRCDFFNNRSTGSGGSIFSVNRPLSISSTRFLANRGSRGGALYLEGAENGAKSEFNGVLMDENSADYGGAIFATGSLFSGHNLTLVNNVATSQGSALFANADAQVDLFSSSASYGSGTLLYSGTDNPAEINLHYSHLYHPNAEIQWHNLAAEHWEGMRYNEPQFGQYDDDGLPLAYHLSGGSPLIDAGMPDVLDLDGSRADIGAFGGQSPYIFSDEAAP